MKNSIKMQKDAVPVNQGKKYTVVNQSYLDRLELYQSAKWKTFSKNYLKDNPFCVECLKRGVSEEATVTDHILGHDPLRWKETFWTGPFQAMCWSHHSQKTHREQAMRKSIRMSAKDRLEQLQKLKGEK